jgi:hypothetical protein
MIRQCITNQLFITIALDSNMYGNVEFFVCCLVEIYSF